MFGNHDFFLTQTGLNFEKNRRENILFEFYKLTANLLKHLLQKVSTVFPLC